MLLPHFCSVPPLQVTAQEDCVQRTNERCPTVTVQELAWLHVTSASAPAVMTQEDWLQFARHRSPHRMAQELDWLHFISTGQSSPQLIAQPLVTLQTQPAGFSGRQVHV